MKKSIERKKINLDQDNLLYVPHITKEEIEVILNNVMKIEIRDIEIYQRALVHKSIQKHVKSSEFPEKVLGYLKESNECLELVGDATIGLIIADYLYKRFPEKAEGDLTKYRTRIVRGSRLAYFAEMIGLKGRILMSDQVIKMNGNKNKRFLEDAFEAFVGALYYDKGFEITKEFVLKVVEKYLNEEDLLKDDNYKDFLLRYAQFSNIDLPVYSIISEEGKPNERIFTVVVELFGKRQGKGKSKKKKDAEQLAAKDAIKRLNINTHFGME